MGFVVFCGEFKEEFGLGQTPIMQVEECLDAKHPNTNWCNNTGKACVMQIEESVYVSTEFRNASLRKCIGDNTGI